MISRCEEMYEDVSSRLQQEGKDGLYEDERLFISMINRLNGQALDIEDAPEQKKRPAQQRTGALAVSTSNKTENSAISTLRSIVEESEALAGVRTKRSETVNSKKRESSSSKDNGPKRPKK